MSMGGGSWLWVPVVIPFVGSSHCLWVLVIVCGPGSLSMGAGSLFMDTWIMLVGGVACSCAVHIVCRWGADVPGFMLLLVGAGHCSWALGCSWMLDCCLWALGCHLWLIGLICVQCTSFVGGGCHLWPWWCHVMCVWCVWSPLARFNGTSVQGTHHH